MFAKKFRLAHSKDVKATIAQGRNFFNPFCVIKFVKKIQGVSRFTIVVSTKVAKKAVLRNRLKRITREYIRLNLSFFKLGDYVIIMKPKAAEANEKIFKAELEKLFKKYFIHEIVN